MKRILSIFVIAVMLLSINCFADVTDLDDMRVLLTVETGIPNEMMNVEVFAPNKTYDDLADAENIKEVLVYRRQVNTDEKGDISLNIEVDGNEYKSGIYTFEVMGEKYSISLQHLITNSKTAKEIIEDINSSMQNDSAESTKLKISAYLENSYYDLYVQKKGIYK